MSAVQTDRSLRPESRRTSTLGTRTASASAVDNTAVVTTCSLNAAARLPMLGITALSSCDVT